MPGACVMMTSALRCTERLKAEDGKVSLLVDQPYLTECYDLGRLGMTASLMGVAAAFAGPVWISGLAPASVTLFCFWPP